eukprot:CAMPEP_0117523658 /NCGR_PEP_ID=MMETSP0784-20121206/34841_1 /TAXON_ID=39447 /ORGANISM="" /LENGTH=226 /DNA_ID=CAMNT_0005319777 /DNA_START=29 /DNA_END=707 /DNA_ORIENTATION=-
MSDKLDLRSEAARTNKAVPDPHEHQFKYKSLCRTCALSSKARQTSTVDNSAALLVLTSCLKDAALLLSRRGAAAVGSTDQDSCCEPGPGVRVSSLWIEPCDPLVRRLPLEDKAAEAEARPLDVPGVMYGGIGALGVGGAACSGAAWKAAVTASFRDAKAASFLASLDALSARDSAWIVFAISMWTKVIRTSLATSSLCAAKSTIASLRDAPAGVCKRPWALCRALS